MPAFLPSIFLDQFIQSLSTALWNRPELAPLREPIETALKGNEFKKLTQQAFEQFAQANALPRFFDAEFITQSPVQERLAAYVLEGKAADVDELVRRYRDYISRDEAGFRDVLAKYLQQVRDTFVTNPAYSGLILARGQDTMLDAISVFRREVHDRLDALGADQKTASELILKRLDDLYKEPEMKALVERKQGTHIFLSYSRHNAEIARQIREALEKANHTVWQDTTVTTA